MLEINQAAPDFSTPDQFNREVKLTDFNEKHNVILYFYPKDDTSGCTIEANQFTELVAEFHSLDTVVLGVSKDSPVSHEAFIKKYNLGIDLLSDTTGELCEAYGVWQEKEKNGIKKMGIVRSTFVIDKAGKLIDVMYGVTADGHAQDVLDKIKTL
jgi:peroxiredoxin